MPDKTVRDFVAAYLRPHRPRLALLAILFLAGIGLLLVNPLLAKTFIDQASAGAPFDRLVHIAGAFLAVALLFSGLPGEREHQRRVDGVLTTLYEELGLA